jgi:HAD superfamily hydrolase (TIGR01509 family)
MRQLSEVASRHGLIMSAADEATVIGTDGTKSLQRLIDAAGLDLDPLALLDEAEAQGNIHVIYDMVPMPGVVEAIRGLRDRGLATALVSTTLSPFILHALDQIGIVSLFDSIVCGDMIDHRKPDPECYLRSLANLGMDASHGVAFEDSPVGIRAAKSAGLYVVGCEASIIDQDTSEADETIKTFVGFTL